MNKLRNLHKTFVLVLVLVTGATLRLHRVDQPYIDAFAWRETSTAMMASNFYRDDWNILYPQVSWGGAGPNYQGREFQTITYISALLYTVFGQRDWVGRSVAIVFGIWGIFALFKLVSEVWDRTSGLMVAAFLAVMPGSVFIDRSFLPDPAMVAIATTSLWVFVVFCRTRRMSLLGAALVLWTLASLTKPQGLTVAAPAIYAVTAIVGQDQLSLRLRTSLYAGALVCLGVVVSYYWWAIYLSRSYPPYHLAGTGKFLWDEGESVSRWLENGYFVDELVKNATGWLWTWIGGALFLVGLMLKPKPSDRRARPWLFHWWLV